MTSAGASAFTLVTALRSTGASRVARSAAGRATLRLALAGLLGSLLTAVAPAAPGYASPCVASASDVWAAEASARTCGRAVEAMSLRTESSQTAVNADGTRTLTRYVEPRWVRGADGAWADLDTALRRAGGVLVPHATLLRTSFSGGGPGPLATVSDGVHELAVFSPWALPAPTMAGDSAVYPEVLPGVDLRLTAAAAGFSQVVVVKTRAALANPALARIEFGLATKGVVVSAAGSGGAEARDARGEVVFSSPAPVMWDSTGHAEGPSLVGGGMSRSAVMAEQVSATHLAVVPDPAMLADAGVRLPLYIDPSWGSQANPGWKNVASRPDVANSPTFALENAAVKGGAGAGRLCDVVISTVCQSVQYVVRSMFSISTNGLGGKHVLSSTFNITQRWSWTCSPASNAKLWLTPAFTSGTTWNNQGGWDGGHTAQAPASHKYGGGPGCSGPDNVAFDATAMVSFGVAQGWTGITFGLAAVDENVLGQWKRFDAATASLSVLYNSYPDIPDTRTTHGQSCVEGPDRPVVATASPVFSAQVTDPDGAGEGDIGGSLRGEFWWERSQISQWLYVGVGSGTPQAGGTTSPTSGPAFGHGEIGRWRVRAANSWSVASVGSGTDYSSWAGWCEFEVDTAPPNTAVVTPDAGNTPFVTGKTVRLTLTPGGSPADTDITGYEWWVVDGAGTHATGFAAGLTAVVDWTPIAGQGTVHVRAKDRIQTSVADATYVFNAAQLSTEVARWRLDEPAGATTLADSTGNGHHATLIAGQTGQPGRIVNGDTALSVGEVSETVDTAGPVLDTSRNFTVSAWARLAAKTGSQVIAVQMGIDASPIYLLYQGNYGYDRWEFSAPSSDQITTTWTTAGSPAVPRVGVWTHVAGVYDAAADELRLYVNGTLVSTAGGAVLWNSTGHFRIGQSMVGASFNGSIADLRVWDRALSGAELADIVDPTSAENVTTTNVGQWLVEPASCFGSPVTCQDSSAYAHDLGLTGDVAVTPAGQSGSGLQYGAAHGVARTTNPNTGLAGPVLHTDQSFTISAWVKLAALPTGNSTALGQEGTRISGFFLGVSRTAPADGLPHWCLTMGAADDPAGGGWQSAVAPAALTAVNVGTWTHLVGVYDAVAQTITLYVDGVQAATTSFTSPPWDAQGALTIGGALWHVPPNAPQIQDWWSGGIDTVYAYAGAVPASSINRIP